MALTLEQWKEILNAVEFNNNPGDVLEQIKAKLKEQCFDTYQKWKRKGFDVNHLFNVLLHTLHYQIDMRCTLLHMAT
ncbi:hypothetical protein [Wolbachia endosymbiont of Ctenocephalides felis wCfeJ]|uniref:hypothetical protein n=1 Tax=Wolbachia endosymbiont of Ctenocephalides felis wCfeJ TaxID=2732594 RepID=UPI001446D19B|nr:hypothetical protein [Wolbachia endosymbiont of Ctenocephalides felis wCfeJ]WCR58339.1 MAG: hypothetical protein PG980_000811 [Wolbachia endosymbiont of Ctenocephalides felis wCfeJ]